MSIEKITSNMEVSSGQKLLTNKAVKNRVYLDAPKDTVSFTGGKAKVITNLKEYMLGLMPNKIKWMVKLHEKMGEVQNQLINAAGTGLVAPIFIKYNPISDTDKDTRTYTAWRQPVSAVLAVATQSAIVIPFNKMIQNAADIGFFGTAYNSSLFPSDDYLAKEVKALNPGKHYTKNEMKEAVAKYQKETYGKELVKMIENDQIVFNTTDGKNLSKVVMPKEDFKALFVETLDNIIKSEEIERHKVINQKFTSKLNRGIFYKNNADEARAVLRNIRENLAIIYGNIDLDPQPRKIARANREFKKYCNGLIKELKAEGKKDAGKKDVNAQLAAIVDEVKNKSLNSDTSNFKVLNDKLDKMFKSIDTMEAKKSTAEITSYIEEVINRRTDAIDGTIATLTKIKNKLVKSGITVKNAQEIVNQAIENSKNAVITELRVSGVGEKDLHKTANWVESSGTRLKEKAGSIAASIGEQLKKHAKSNIDGMKRWTGLAVSLAILPATCWMLNKIYPWFMDKAFPSLSNKAAEAKENKNKKVEVK